MPTPVDTFLLVPDYNHSTGKAWFKRLTCSRYFGRCPILPPLSCCCSQEHYAEEVAWSTIAVLWVARSTALPVAASHPSTWGSDISQSKFQPRIPELWVTSPGAGLSAPDPRAGVARSSPGMHYISSASSSCFLFRADSYLLMWLFAGGKHTHSQHFMGAFHLQCKQLCKEHQEKKGISVQPFSS